MAKKSEDLKSRDTKEGFAPTLLQHGDEQHGKWVGTKGNTKVFRVSKGLNGESIVETKKGEVHFTEEEVESLDIVRPFGMVGKRELSKVVDDWRTNEMSLVRPVYMILRWAINLFLVYWYISRLPVEHWLPHCIAAFFFEPFMFGLGHVLTHFSMLQGYQCKMITTPLAFFHHYTESRLYGMYPYRYIALARIGDSTFTLILWVFGFDVVFVMWVAIWWEIDFSAHMWYHSNYKEFNRWNIFIDYARWIGTGMFIQVAEKCGLVCKSAHMMLHHAEFANTQEETGAWCDWFPYTHHLVEIYGDAAYLAFQKYFIRKDRGTYLPVFLNDLYQVHDCRPLAGGLGLGAVDIESSLWDLHIEPKNFYKIDRDNFKAGNFAGKVSVKGIPKSCYSAEKEEVWQKMCADKDLMREKMMAIIERDSETNSDEGMVNEFGQAKKTKEFSRKQQYDAILKAIQIKDDLVLNHGKTLEDAEVFKGHVFETAITFAVKPRTLFQHFPNYATMKKYFLLKDPPKSCSNSSACVKPDQITNKETTKNGLGIAKLYEDSVCQDFNNPLTKKYKGSLSFFWFVNLFYFSVMIPMYYLMYILWPSVSGYSIDQHDVWNNYKVELNFIHAYAVIYLRMMVQLAVQPTEMRHLHMSKKVHISEAVPDTVVPVLVIYYSFIQLLFGVNAENNAKSGWNIEGKYLSRNQNEVLFKFIYQSMRCCAPEPGIIDVLDKYFFPYLATVLLKEKIA